MHPRSRRRLAKLTSITGHEAKDVRTHARTPTRSQRTKTQDHPATCLTSRGQRKNAKYAQHFPESCFITNRTLSARESAREQRPTQDRQTDRQSYIKASISPFPPVHDEIRTASSPGFPKEKISMVRLSRTPHLGPRRRRPGARGVAPGPVHHRRGIVLVASRC